ncbi:uncharacterized protein ACBT44_003431 isoform 9-T10 [Syngnathus typhle]
MFNDHENAFIWRATKQLKQLTVATSGRQRRLAEGANPQNEPVMADFLVQNGHLAVLAWLHETFSDQRAAVGETSSPALHSSLVSILENFYNV